MFFERACVPCGGVDGPVCRRCTGRLEPLAATAGADRRAAVELNDTARSIVAALKYHRERRVAAAMAGELVRVVPAGADLITWVPATPQRVRRRGFDHGREIARAVSVRTGVPARRLLRRRARDDRQTGRTLEARSVGPALLPVRERPWGPREMGLVVVVDDVLTTGASLDRAHDTLTMLGAGRVVSVAFAQTPRRHRLRGCGACDSRSVSDRDLRPDLR